MFFKEVFMLKYSYHFDDHSHAFQGGIPKSKAQFSKVTGFLCPISWDNNGRIKKFAIYTDAGEDIIIEGSYRLSKLRSLTNKLVLAKGVITEDEYEDKFINLKSIKEIKSPNSPIPIQNFDKVYEKYSLQLNNTQVA